MLGIELKHKRGVLSEIKRELSLYVVGLRVALFVCSALRVAMRATLLAAWALPAASLLVTLAPAPRAARADQPVLSEGGAASLREQMKAYLEMVSLRWWHRSDVDMRAHFLFGSHSRSPMGHTLVCGGHTLLVEIAGSAR